MHISIAAGVLLAAGVLAAAPGAAQAPAGFDPPRTAGGRPDFGGVWSASFSTQLERPEGVADLIVAPERAAEVVKKLTWTPKGVYDPDIEFFVPNALLSINGELRSSWLIEPHDGRMPFTSLAHAAFDRSDELEDYGFDNPEERPASERCISGLGHPPLHGISAVIPSQIVQTPEAIIIATEDTDSGRIIHLDGQAPPDAMRTRAGYSAGHWEGDTLIVETTHIAAQDPTGVVYRGDVVLTEGSRTTERFRLISANELLYGFTVTDPALYNRPWFAEYVLNRSDGAVYEYACHEGNYAMFNGLLAARIGRQPDKASVERKKAAAKKADTGSPP